MLRVVSLHKSGTVFVENVLNAINFQPVHFLKVKFTSTLGGLFRAP